MAVTISEQVKQLGLETFVLELFRQLAGFNDRFPYAEQAQPVPVLADA